MNDVLLNRKKIIKFINTDEKKKHKNQGYTTEQIHKIIDVCDERTKAIILIFASTGIRLSALITLKIGDLKRIKLDDFELYEVTVYQGYRDEYTTFCTPECVNVIDSYLAYRKRCGEQLKDNAPLIREQFDATDPFRVKHPKHLSIITIAKILRLKIIQAGLREVIHVGNDEGSKYRKDVPLVHGFRKFFNTALMNADVNLTFKELLMGHSLKLDDVYYDKNNKKSQAKLLNEYCKAIDYLTISEENRLKIKVEQLTVEKSQMDELQAQIDRLRELIKIP